MGANNSIVEMFWESNRDSIDREEKGIRIPKVFSADADGHLTAAALALDTIEQGYAVIKTFWQKSPAELIFGWDRYAKPEQGIEWGDFLSVQYFNGRKWFFGVMEYRIGSEIECKPINWKNAIWAAFLAHETGSNLRLSQLIIYTGPACGYCGGTEGPWQEPDLCVVCGKKRIKRP